MNPTRPPTTTTDGTTTDGTTTDGTTTDSRAAIVAAITATAPDVVDDIADVGDDVDLFEEFGLDSMDRLNIMTAISESTGVDIPDDRYSELTTMRALIGLAS